MNSSLANAVVPWRNSWPKSLATALVEIIDASTRATNGRRKNMGVKKGNWASLGICDLSLGALALGGLLLEAQPAFADATPAGNYCVQSNLQVSKLNCTANDTKLAGVKSVSGVPVISPTECTKDETFSLTGTFLLQTNASERYDIGITFSSDGDPNGDGARTGTCSRVNLPIGTALDLDKDSCGDITSAMGLVEVQVSGLQVKCVDTDGDGFVNLPYIIGWAQNAQSVCQNAAQALPGTTSKCEINDTFNIPVAVEEPNNALTKNATVVVTYPITLTNNASSLTLTLNTLTDDIYGNIASSSNTSILSTTCGQGGAGNPGTLPATIAATGSYSCSFKVQFDKNNPGSSNAVVNTVTAEGTASDGVHTPTPFTTQSNVKSVTVLVGP
jgi:hypothetical protein